MPFVRANSYHAKLKIEPLSKLDGLFDVQPNEIWKGFLGPV
jgi:hypothetical protein